MVKIFARRKIEAKSFEEICERKFDEDWEDNFDEDLDVNGGNWAFGGFSWGLKQKRLNDLKF